MKTMFMIAIGSVTCLLMMSCQPSGSRTVVPKDPQRQPTTEKRGLYGI